MNIWGAEARLRYDTQTLRGKVLKSQKVVRSTYLSNKIVKLVEKAAPGTVKSGRGEERKQELASFWLPLLRRMMVGVEYAALNLVTETAVLVVPSNDTG